MFDFCGVVFRNWCVACRANFIGAAIVLFCNVGAAAANTIYNFTFANVAYSGAGTLTVDNSLRVVAGSVIYNETPFTLDADGGEVRGNLGPVQIGVQPVLNSITPFSLFSSSRLHYILFVTTEQYFNQKIAFVGVSTCCGVVDAIHYYNSSGDDGGTINMTSETFTPAGAPAPAPWAGWFGWLVLAGGRVITLLRAVAASFSTCVRKVFRFAPAYTRIGMST